MSLRQFRRAQVFVDQQSNFSKFSDLELIGTGSNGVVFKCKAVDDSVEGDLALKVVINYGTDPLVLLGSAVQEQSSVSYIPPHRNIVEIFGIVGPAPIPQKIFDCCPDLMREASSRNDAVGIVMRYHPHDLEHFLAKARAVGSATPYDLFGMCMDVLLALRHLQRYRCLHLDVKLNNFLVTRDLTVVLTDFGCAERVQNEDWTLAVDVESSNVGNSSHLAPEVLQALQEAHADGSSRVLVPCRRQLEFAAGVLLYELLMGQGNPFGSYPINLEQLQDPNSSALQDNKAVINAAIAGLTKHGFSEDQQQALRVVLNGLLCIDPANRMSLLESVRCLGAVDKNETERPTLSGMELDGGTKAPTHVSAGSLKNDPMATDRILEVWVLGASFVGKSLLMSAFTGAKYKPVTVGVNSGWRNVRPGMPKGFQVRVWDTAGQKIFRNSMAGLTSRNAFVVLVFDVTAPSTFAELKDIHEQLVMKGRMSTCVVVANKIDLEGERKISESQGLELAVQLQAAGYFETSAQNEEGVHELFHSIFQIAERLDKILPRPTGTDEREMPQVTVVNQPQQPARKKCAC